MWKSEISEGAEVDLRDATRWYRERDSRVAVNFVLAVEKKLESIQQDPERFATIGSEIYGAQVEDFPFQIIYRLYDRTVDIIAVAHHSRRSGYWNTRLND